MKALKDAKCNKSCFLWKITIIARNSLTSLLQKNKQAINYKLQLNKILKFISIRESNLIKASEIPGDNVFGVP